MTALADLLKAQITATGPMRLDAYMAACLMHPDHGYYTTRDPFGTSGDFTTAPEISQMFGELVGLSLMQAWMDQGAPSGIALVELGPGRGTLMADILRVSKAVPGFQDALSGVHLVETSPGLRARQATTVAHDDMTWHDTVETLPDAPLFVVANEFFDALPVRQFQRATAGWAERLVGLVEGQLSLGLGAPQTQDMLAHRWDDTQEGDVVECAPGAVGVVETLGRKIAAHGGAGLVIDYGDWRSLGDTVQAVASHRHTDIFATPGEADLSTHVDFEALARAVPEGCAHSRLTPQGVFLDRLGITGRAETLERNMTEPQRTTHGAAHRRLTHRDEMGTLFKVMGLYPKVATPPPGLEP